MLRVLLVDDEKPARTELRYLLEQFPDVTVVGEAASGEEALELIAEIEPHAVFLDIHLQDTDGVSVAEQLLSMQERAPFVIFASAYDSHALRAYETDAIDYLVKPFSEQRLGKSISRLRKMYAKSEESRGIESRITTLLQTALADQQPKRIPVEKNGKILLIDSAEIVFATMEGRHAVIHTDDQQYQSSFTLQELETKLPPAQFHRTHRAFIVNLARVNELVPWFNGSVQLIMQDHMQTSIPVSRTSVKEVKKRLGF